jgi:cleavage and polyadenylation specificity factor subunit 3
MPPNQIEVKFRFARRRSAKVMGSLADRESELQEGEGVRGILVTQNFHSKLVAPGDLATFTPLRVGSISSKLHVPFAGSMETLKLFLHEMFADVKEASPLGGEGPTTLVLHGGEVSCTRRFHVLS